MNLLSSSRWRLGSAGAAAPAEPVCLEKLARQLEESFRLLFEANPAPMWVFDEETLRFLAVNNAAIEHYGYSREQFLSMSLLDIRPREDWDARCEATKNDRAVATPERGISACSSARHILFLIVCTSLGLRGVVNNER
jgi:PAS domain-containing protein